jgi:hypothetical protein
MNVTKTLVIGLGSSGIEVCDRLIERIRWELGDIKRAPWVRFLGIETNSNVATDLRDMGDLLLLTISAEDYAMLVDPKSHLAKQFHISEWADLRVLSALPTNEVTAGAGNIRMVGRLAFFYRCGDIEREVRQRLNALSTLTSAEATEKRGVLLDGENPPVDFVGGIRIFVVGTLCGGTCSGMVSDFGFLLRVITEQDRSSKIIGMFTLPPPNLTAAIEPLAERHKKNVYTALVELNHYHLVGRSAEPPIILPLSNERKAPLDATPYDGPYLLFPSGIKRDDIQSLHQTIAERIFLNIFAPDTDPFQRAVDAPYQVNEEQQETIRGDRFHRAHVFLSVGVATMEYPAERIINACTYRQLAYTLRQWNSRPLQDHEIASRLKDLGLEWERLCEWLFHTPTGESLEMTIRQRAEEIADLAANSPQQGRQRLSELRQVFVDQAIVPNPPSQSLYPGVAISTCLLNKERARAQFQEALRALISRDLCNYHVGPTALRDVFVRAQEWLDQLAQQRLPDVTEASQRVNRLLDKIESCKCSRKLAFVGLRGKELRRLQSELKRALNEEMKQRLTAAIITALNDRHVGHGGREPGLISLLGRELKALHRKFVNLTNRVARQAELFDEQDHRLSRTEPPVAGVALFKSDPDGTVTEEYQRCLEKSASQGIPWTQQREQLASDIVKAWRDFLVNQVSQDWLYNDFKPQHESPFPPSLIEPIINEARRPFREILKSDVFEKWWTFYHDPSIRTEHARAIFQRVIPSVKINPFLAARGRSPIATWNVLAVPPGGNYRDEFLQAITSAPGFPANSRRAESPFPYRIIMLQEWHRWPLSGVPDITGENGLCSAVCNDFPTFHTRKDVAWTPLTEKEVERLDVAYRWLILGVLCDFVVPRRGVLEIERGGAMGEACWRLPLSLAAAAHQIAITQRDEDGHILNDIETILGNRVEMKRREHESDEDFVRFLFERIDRGSGSEIPDWDATKSRKVVVWYCAKYPSLTQALMSIRPIPEEVKQNLWKNRGDEKPRGGVYEEPGYYCSICGGLIGKDEEEALQNAWCCYVNPDHCFYKFE